MLFFWRKCMVLFKLTRIRRDRYIRNVRNGVKEFKATPFFCSLHWLILIYFSYCYVQAPGFFYFVGNSGFGRGKEWTQWTNERNSSLRSLSLSLSLSLIGESFCSPTTAVYSEEIYSVIQEEYSAMRLPEYRARKSIPKLMDLESHHTQKT